jgi:PAS domain S-box-containing protein
VTVWSKGAEDMYGWTADEAVGREVERFVRFRMTVAERAEMRRRTAHDGRTRRDAIAVRKDGTRVEVDLLNVALRDDNGTLTGYLGIHRDITERKAMEADRARRAGGRTSRDVRVLLVEDHAAVREALAGAFEREAGFDVVGQAASLRQARGMLHDVDVAVLDLGLPDGYGGDLIRDLRAASPRAQALVLSATLDRGQVARAVDSGAAAALDKTAHLHEVVDAVRRLRDGEALLSMDEVVELLRFARRRRDEEHADRQAIQGLTAREREVLQALADGLSTRGVAEHLHITMRTARNHIASILAKLGVHSQLQALVFALRYAVVEIAKRG